MLRSLFVAYTQAGTTFAKFGTLLGLLIAWAVAYASGGSHSAWPHLFYIPIILAAVRFSFPGATVTATAAGLLAGPALPADVSAHTPQDLWGWLLRLAMFLTIGVFVAAIMRGRNEPNKRALQDAITSGQLLRALDSGDIEVFYQPIYRLSDNDLVGFEALARWRDPRRGYIGPEQFIPAAERTGAVTKLDSYVLRTTAQQAQRWARCHKGLVISVNVSATRFGRCDLTEEVQQVLLDSGLPARSLQLEITESALVQDLPSAVQQVRELRALGVKIAIDDFGTGQASVNYLDEFDVDTFKLDRSLVTKAATRPRTQALLVGLVRLANDLHLRVVAEGVESEPQQTMLRDAGVHLAQGFLLGRPGTTQDAAALLQRAPQPL